MLLSNLFKIVTMKEREGGAKGLSSTVSGWRESEKGREKEKVKAGWASTALSNISVT